jgi:hypothetical protein
MSNIRNWSTTPGNNNSAPPNGAPEGMAPSSVNDIMRQQMADHRTQWTDAEWMDWGDTPSRASASSFKIATDVTARYHAGRRVKCYDATTLYGVVASSSYSAPDTTINVTTDSGNLTASLTSVALGILSAINPALPSETNKSITGTLQVGGTTSLSAAVVCKTSLTVEGITTLSGVAILKGATTIEGAVTISGAAVFKTTASFEGEITCSASLVCKGTFKLDTANLNRKSTDIASATTTDLSTATGDFADITGTTTITGLGTMTAGVERTVRFTGALTLTHNATSLILPGAINKTTASGDTAVFRSLGSGNWICISYKPATFSYQEGTFTPTIIGLSSAGTASYTTQTGEYTRIGNRVFFYTRVKWSSATGTGQMAVSGLPFTCAENCTCAILYDAVTFAASKEANALAISGQIYISLYTADPSGGAIANTAVDAAGELFISGFYRV